MHRAIVAFLCLLALSAQADRPPAVEVRFECLLGDEGSALKTKNVDRAQFHRTLAKAIADQGNANFGFLEWTSTETKDAARTLVVKLEERAPNSPLPEYVVRYYLAVKGPDGKVIKETRIGWLGGQMLYTPGTQQFFNPTAYEKDLACRAWSDFTGSKDDVLKDLLGDITLCSSHTVGVDNDRQHFEIHVSSATLHAHPHTHLFVDFKAKRLSNNVAVDGKLDLTDLKACPACKGQPFVGSLGSAWFPETGLVEKGHWDGRLKTILSRERLTEWNLKMLTYEPAADHNRDPLNCGSRSKEGQ